MRQIAALGIASGQAGSGAQCGDGPRRLRHSDSFMQRCREGGVELVWQGLLEPEEHISSHAAIAGLCRQAARHSAALVRQGRPFVCFSGDHSTAMGIWAGVLGALSDQRLGLIWIDAHMDAHTFLTTPSGKVHGMPVAGLLGQGDDRLWVIYGDNPNLRPEDLILMGVRSYEAEEQALLVRLGVEVIGINQLREPGALCSRLTAAIDQLLSRVERVGISIDLDAIDPQFAPGVMVPERAGIAGDELAGALAAVGHRPELVGLEIAEYCPRLDREDKTLALVGELVSGLYGDTSTLSR